MWSDVSHALSASNVAWVVIVAVRVCPSDLCMVYAHVTLSLRWPFGPPRGEAPTRRTLLYGQRSWLAFWGHPTLGLFVFTLLISTC